MLYGNFENCPKVKWKKYTDNTDLKNDWNYHVSWYIFIGFASSISFLLSLLVSYARTLFLSQSMASLLLWTKGSSAIACINIFFLSKSLLLNGPLDDVGTPQHSDSRPSLRYQTYKPLFCAHFGSIKKSLIFCSLFHAAFEISKHQNIHALIPSDSPEKRG